MSRPPWLGSLILIYGGEGRDPASGWEHKWRQRGKDGRKKSVCDRKRLRTGCFGERLGLKCIGERTAACKGTVAFPWCNAYSRQPFLRLWLANCLWFNESYISHIVNTEAHQIQTLTATQIPLLHHQTCLSLLATRKALWLSENPVNQL